jgi:serine phosphatase RsbU (regulator of sigma subunit)
MKAKQISRSRQSPEKILEAGRQNLGASSCIFYILDPWWIDQFVPVFMPGVNNTEPMHGFVLPVSSYERVTGVGSEGKELYIEDTSQADELLDQMTPTLSQLARENNLFGNFVQREQIGSCTRLRRFSPDDGKLEAILWINFSNPRKRFAKRKMRKLMDAMVGYLPDIIERYKRENPFPVNQLLHILNPAEQLATIGRPLNEQNLDWYLEKILDAVLRAFNIQEDTGIGTIHLFDPATQVLNRKIHKGIIADSAPQVQNVQLGEGIISWVALKRRALLIADLGTSRFGSIYKEFAPNAISELAVPMLAGDELLGVVNLESIVSPCPFSEYSVRTIWYTASQAAIACRLFQQASIAHTQTERTSQLLQLAHDAVVKTKSSQPLVGLAELARDWLQAGGCDIWQCREDRHRFISSGASYDHDPSSLPRENGWSQYVRTTKTPVWIFNVVDTETFNCNFWNHDEQIWEPFNSGNPIPEKVNERLIDLNVHCELGIPIEVTGKCVGVAWLKYTDEHTPEPTPLNMQLAHGFAAQAGLVIDVLQRQEESAKNVDALRDYRDRLFKTGHFELPGLRGYVIRHACGEVGGDFHIWQEIDDRRTSFLVGDAEGHDILGALYMLPMITTFKGFSRQSCSTKHILWRLLPVCDTWELRGTAICFIIDRSEGKGKRPLIFASSAGHPPLIIFKEDRQNFDFPDKKAEWANRGQLGIGLNLPLGEEVKELSSGDIIIAYTDGVLEPSRDIYPVGRAGIIEAASMHFAETPEIIAKAIEEKVMSHAGGHLEDDVTIMVLRVE